ncbi:MAG TPA: CocE/NonD family hydrolase C-terminal non-catalytic domain-containing protein [Gemmatimonadales bacterium]|nr:CocE/NonD family hydrolase C-terminal non-catalytic domain-containing protein [Gemmatimonadales bacterium]
MANGTMRVYLTTERAGGAHRLGTALPAAATGTTQTTDPLPQATELSGLFSGRLDFVTNKKDFDFSVALFELTPQHRYLQLSSCRAPASYVGHLSRRRLLTGGAHERIVFTACG